MYITVIHTIRACAFAQIKHIFFEMWTFIGYSFTHGCKTFDCQIQWLSNASNYPERSLNYRLMPIRSILCNGCHLKYQRYKHESTQMSKQLRAVHSLVWIKYANRIQFCTNCRSVVTDHQLQFNWYQQVEFHLKWNFSQHTKLNDYKCGWLFQCQLKCNTFSTS